MLKVMYFNSHAECRYDECRHAECRGAIKTAKIHFPLLKTRKQNFLVNSGAQLRDKMIGLQNDHSTK